MILAMILALWLALEIKEVLGPPSSG
jgi:hypothetical protein